MKIITRIACIVAVSLHVHHYAHPGESMKSEFMKFESMKLADRYRNVPVLVTGGCGFIGSHIVERLVGYGAQVTVLDDCSTGNEQNIAPFNNKIRYIRGSVADMQTCLEAAHGAQIIFHLGAFISVPQSLEQPDVCYRNNIDGTAHLLEAARCCGVPRFVFSSSAAVYGPQAGVCRESMPCAPESPYGYSKWIGELLCQQYTRCFGLKTVCLRYFNVYGDRQNPDGAYAAVVAKFKHQMQHNLPITIFGDGLQTRDFVPVARVVDANLQLALLDDSLMLGQVFNIATGTSITLLELIDILKKEFPNYTGAIQFAPARPGDIQHSAADCSTYQALVTQLPTILNSTSTKTSMHVQEPATP